MNEIRSLVGCREQYGGFASLPPPSGGLQHKFGRTGSRVLVRGCSGIVAGYD